MNENFAQLLEETFPSNVRVGDVVSATVLSIDGDFVTVNAGLKSEGVIARSEFLNEAGDLDVAVGDEVDVALEAIEDGYGETLVSREKAKRFAAWRKLEKSHQAAETVTGMITDKVKGGFTVDVGGVKAFLPGSLVDVRPTRGDISHLEGQMLEFKVIKMDQKRNNIVVSRKAVVQEESSADRKALLDNLQEGQELKGIVKNLTDYGAFVDLGGIDGLLHITDISWKRVKHPSEVLTVGSEVTVKVLKFDRERSRVSLGMKQLGDDPWLDLMRRYPEDTRLSGKVTNITDYGCFVEIENGVEGLVHMSEMDWTNKNVHPSKVVQLGEEVNVIVLEIDEERRRISLGMKQCLENPWVAFSAAHQKGGKISGSIRSITDFGIFVGLVGDIDGLIHLTDISWDVPGEEAVQAFKKGQEIEAMILAVDPERERISLGLKQLNADPFLSYTELNPKGSVVTAKVSEVDAKFMMVELAEEVLGKIRAQDISAEKVEDARLVFKVGDDVEAKVVTIDNKNRTITLSIKAKDAEEEKEALKKFSEDNKDVSSGTTLGDLLKEKIDNKD